MTRPTPDKNKAVVEPQKSFDFEQDKLDTGSADSDGTEGWGSEFEGDDDVDNFEVEADSTGQVVFINTLHDILNIPDISMQYSPLRYIFNSVPSLCQWSS